MDNDTLLLETFCKQHQLPPNYVDLAKHWFLPLAQELAQYQQTTKKPTLFGINGSQGSGKSTLSDLLETLLMEYYGINTVTLSIDDFYLTRQERAILSANVHPLFKTRGVPGTHNTALLSKTIDRLFYSNETISIPRFNKTTDDRAAKHQWDRVQTPIDLILLEGWCIGTTALSDEELSTPINTLEKDEDSHGDWRRYSNQRLGKEYAEIFSQLDKLIFLQAPDFNCVYQWRKKYEDKMRAEYLENSTFENNYKESVGLMDDEELLRFVNHYQRFTEHNLDQLPKRADIVFTLDKNHDVIQRHNN